MKLLLGIIILAGCVGALGLSSLAQAASVQPPSAGTDAGSMVLGQVSVRPDYPAAPGQPSDPDRFLVDFDPQSEPDDEARLVPVGGLDRGLRDWLTPSCPALLPPAPLATRWVGRLPRCFPIRC